MSGCISTLWVLYSNYPKCVGSHSTLWVVLQSVAEHRHTLGTYCHTLGSSTQVSWFRVIYDQAPIILPVICAKLVVSNIKHGNKQGAICGQPHHGTNTQQSFPMSKIPELERGDRDEIHGTVDYCNMLTIGLLELNLVSIKSWSSSVLLNGSLVKL